MKWNIKMNEVVNSHYRENYSLLVKRMYRRLNSLEDAEDVVQEAFTRALQYYPSYDSKKCKRFENWFNVVLSNVYKKFVNEKRLAGLSKSLEDATDELEPVIVDHFRCITKKEIKRLMGDKPNDVREILSLHLMYGYAPSEISLLVSSNTRRVNNVLYNFSQELKELYPRERGGV